MQKHLISVSAILCALLFMSSCTEYKGYAPVNPDASKEARQLLSFLYSIQGEYTLAGQHNFSSDLDKYNIVVEEMTGKTPVIWGSDFSFNVAGETIRNFQHCGPMNISVPWGDCQENGLTTDELRQRLVDKAIEEHAKGRIITLMWHCCYPTSLDTCNGEEIWVWQNAPSDETWEELVTEGTGLNNAWKKQMDGVAKYLAQLRDAKVPVLWRPYHEMNGCWFWWCNKPGENGFKKLWIMTYKYLTEHHKLNNLLWVWNTNAPRDIPGDEAGPYADFFPGIEYVDVLAADVYHSDYKQSHHDELLELGQGKLITLGEVGDLPTPEQYESQKSWSWFMTWGYFIQNRKNVNLAPVIYDHPHTLTLDRIEFKNGKYSVIK